MSVSQLTLNTTKTVPDTVFDPKTVQINFEKLVAFHDNMDLVLIVSHWQSEVISYVNNYIIYSSPCAYL